jgi:trk system potassium uptake protein TrkA
MMYALIAGAGTVGSYLAERLLAGGHEVRLIEKGHDVVVNLPAALRSITVEADATEPPTLEGAGVRRADLAVAATGTDDENLVVCFLSKHHYRVKRTVARVNDPTHTWMFGKDMGVDVAISQAHIMSHLIEAEVEVGQLIPLLALQEGEVTLVEETIAAMSRARGLCVRELGLPSGAVPVAIVRGSRVLVPVPEAVLEADDRLIVLSNASQQQAVSSALRLED